MVRSTAVWRPVQISVKDGRTDCDAEGGLKSYLALCLSLSDEDRQLKHTFSVYVLLVLPTLVNTVFMFTEGS